MTPLTVFSILLVIISILYLNLDNYMSDCTVIEYTQKMQTRCERYDSNPIYFDHTYTLQTSNGVHNITISNHNSTQIYHQGEIIKCQIENNGKITLKNTVQNVLMALIFIFTLLLILYIYAFTNFTV